MSLYESLVGLAKGIFFAWPESNNFCGTFRTISALHGILSVSVSMLSKSQVFERINKDGSGKLTLEDLIEGVVPCRWESPGIAESEAQVVKGSIFKAASP